MGSDWIHHGEESYPEAAWLQLEVSQFLHFFSIKNLSFETPEQNRTEFSITIYKVHIEKHSRFPFSCVDINLQHTNIVTKGLAPKRQSLSIFFSHHGHQKKEEIIVE